MAMKIKTKSRPKAYSYLRMSTDSQLKGDSLRRQLEASKNYAEKHQLDLVEQIRDIGVSAYKGKNAIDGALGKFLAAISEGVIKKGSYLMIESLDRLSRTEVLHAFSQFASILQSDITIVTLTDSQVYTKESINTNVGQLFTSLGIMLRANEESLIKSIRLKAAWENKRKNSSSKKLTSLVPAWLKLNKKNDQFSVVGKSAITINKIFDLCIEGMGTYSITRYLNEHIEEYSPIGRSGFWYKSYVTKILNSEAVYGLFQPRISEDGKRIDVGDAIEDYFPTIVPKTKFLLAKAKMKNRQAGGGGRKGVGFSNIFTKLVKCGYCKSTVTFKNKGAPPKGGKYLQCSRSDVNHNCDCPAWNYKDFEYTFFEYITEISLKQIFDKSDGKEHIKDFLEKIQINEQAILEIEAKCQTLYTRLENAQLPESAVEDIYKKINAYKATTRALHQENESHKRNLSEVQNRNIPRSKQSINEFLKSIQSSDDAVHSAKLRRQIHNELVSLVSSIYIHNKPKAIVPFNTANVITSALKRHLKQIGVQTDDELDDYFMSSQGEQIYNESERHIEILFRNGEVKTLHPFARFVRVTIEERMAALKKRVNLKKSSVGSL